MTNMKAAERAAELANAQPKSIGDWKADDFLPDNGSSDMIAFVQFIADADAAARKADEAIAYYSISNPTRQVLKPFILPDDVDEAEALVEREFPDAHPANQWALIKIARLAIKRGMELAKEQGK